MSWPPAQSRREKFTAHGLRALGRRALPQQVRIDDRNYRLAQIAKHDFYAATGFYQCESDASDRVVLKMGRDEPFAGVPLAWVGRWLIRREARFHRIFADLRNVPELVATLGDRGLIHRYVPGVPLSRGTDIPAGFFDELQDVMSTVHSRGVAYVDANKMPNLLIGEDGHPYLIDFQISIDLETLGHHRLGRWILKRLQGADAYHILKHKRRLCPDELTNDEREVVTCVAWPIRLHRMVANPYKKFRRHILRRLFQSGRLSFEANE